MRTKVQGSQPNSRGAQSLLEGGDAWIESWKELDGGGRGRVLGGRRGSFQKKKGWEHGERGIKGHGCGVYHHYLEGEARTSCRSGG